MGELAALRPPGGARGVDQGCPIRGAQRIESRRQLCPVNRPALLGELLERLGTRTVDNQDAAQGGQVTGQLGDHCGMRVSLSERQHGF